ncbi:MAG: redoxin domain-containing protein [Elusimicrobia bacterium]|nr:MAG: redoxin domain-containing protein [Elusimicrobiota bacterium]
MTNRFLKPAALALAVGTAAYFLAKPAPAGLAVGSPAPEFRLADLSGRSAALADYKGKVVLVDFWATWCSSCEVELPELKKIHAKYPADQFALLAVSVDEAGPDVVARYAAEKALPFRVLFADEATPKAYRVFGLPTKFLIGRDGSIVKKYLDPPARETLESDIQAALDRRPA